VVAARRSFENAAALLANAGDDDAAHSGDISPARLTDIVRAHLSMLDRRPERAAPGSSHRAGAR
jgi:hypothetical protein